MSERGGLTGIGQSLIAVLPPAYIVMLLFVGVLQYTMMVFVSHQADQRLVLFERVVDACIAQGPLDTARRKGN